MACDREFPCATEGTDWMSLATDTAVRARIAVSTLCPRFPPSIARAMLSEPRLQEMSLPTSA